jgi:hypothetical protein
MSTDEPTQLDRIEAKLDQLLTTTKPARTCGLCAQRARDEQERLEQWKQEFAARHGLTEALRRHQQQHENE